jgi:hypothetical protein
LIRQEIRKALAECMSNGYSFAPCLKSNFTKSEIKSLLNSSKYSHNQNTNLHLSYLNKIKPILFSELIRCAENATGKKITYVDYYAITKIAKPNQTSVSDRGHFDSHLITLITPVKVPKVKSKSSRGQLTFFNKIRNEPTNELSNFFTKLYFYLFYSSSEKIHRLYKKVTPLEIDFYDMRPLLFLGRQNFHFSNPFKSKKSESHILLITHFFDPSPIWGIGRANRFFRKRK